MMKNAVQTISLVFLRLILPSNLIGYELYGNILPDDSVGNFSLLFCFSFIL